MFRDLPAVKVSRRPMTATYLAAQVSSWTLQT